MCVTKMLYASFYMILCFVLIEVCVYSNGVTKGSAAFNVHLHENDNVYSFV